MNMATALKLPLHATTAMGRLVMLAVVALVLVLATVLQRYQPLSPPVWIAPLFAAFGEFSIGIGLLAPCLLLAIDARQLRVPGVQSPLVVGMLFYAALSVALPTVILPAVGSPPSMVITFQVFALLIGLACGLLPRGFMITTMMMPSFCTALLPHFYHPRFVLADLWVISALLLAASVVAWIWQLRRADPYRMGFGTAVVVRVQNMNRYGGAGWRAWDWSPENTTSAMSRFAWKRAVADVRGGGPSRPRHSMRILLGGWLMPKTWHHTLWLCTILVLPMTLFVVLLDVLFPQALLDLWRAFPFFGVAWLLNFTSLFLGLSAVMVMQQRWMKANAELSVLALLPRLGHGAGLIWNLLQASLLPTFCLQLLIAAMLCVIAVMRHADFADGLSALAWQVTALTFAPAFVLACIGGRSLPNWVTGAVAGLSFALTGIGTGLSAAAHASPATGLSEPAFMLVIQLILLTFLCRLGFRGWRGLMRRPHPFLPN